MCGVGRCKEKDVWDGWRRILIENGDILFEKII